MDTVVPGGETPGPGQEEPAAEATMLRMLPGAQLRRLREAAGISAEKAGYEIGRRGRRSAGWRPGGPGSSSATSRTCSPCTACLVEAARLPGVGLQVVTFARGGHTGASGSFPVSRFPVHDLPPDVAGLEQPASAISPGRRAGAGHCGRAAGQLSGEAPGSAETMRFPARLLKNMNRRAAR